MVKSSYEKPTANTIYNDKISNVFYLRLEIRQECPVSLLQFNILLKVLANEIRQEEEINHPVWEEKGKKVKLSLFTNDHLRRKSEGIYSTIRV